MVNEISQEEASVMSRFAYMNFNKPEDFEKKSLKEIATTLREEKEKREAEGKDPWDFGRWGSLSNTEQYAMLADIEAGKYEHLSNLQLKKFENQETTTGFVGYAFEERGNINNTVFAFRGSQGNQLGDDGFLSTLDGKTGTDWIDNYKLMLTGWSKQFEPAQTFVKENMVVGGETFIVAHSKGVANSAYVCATVDGVTGIGFNGPGIGQILTTQQWSHLENSKFTNVVGEECPVGASGIHPENRIFAKEHTFTTRNEYEQDTGLAEGMTLKHGIQALHYGSDGKVITAERSIGSLAAEAATVTAYIANQLTLDPLGNAVDVVQGGKRTFNILDTASNMEQGTRMSYVADKMMELSNELTKMQAKADKNKSEQVRGATTDALQTASTTYADKFVDNTIGQPLIKGVETFNQWADTTIGQPVIKGVETFNQWADTTIGQPLLNAVRGLGGELIKNTPENSENTAQQTSAIQVTVLQGDSMGKIADAMGTTPDKITNSLGQRVYFCNPNTVVNVETELGINGNVAYQVQPGDNWGTISQRSGVSYDELRKNNQNVGEEFIAGTMINYPKPQAWDGQAINSATATSQDNSNPLFNTSFIPRKFDSTIIPVKVLPGDSLVDIANALNVTPDKLTNGKGQQVYVCNGNTVINAEVNLGINGNVLYQVQPGDNWSTISERTGVSYDELRAANTKVGDGFNAGIILNAPRGKVQEQINFLGGGQCASSSELNFNQQLNLGGSAQIPDILNNHVNAMDIGLKDISDLQRGGLQYHR